jgi:hypothetical protein
VTRTEALTLAEIATEEAAMTKKNAIPADINNPRSVASTLSDMIEMASQTHGTCDIDSETECGGEQYGNGSADEHCRLRDAIATLELLRLKHKAAKGVTVVIATEGGIPDVDTKPDYVTVEFIDFDTEGSTDDELCNCGMGSVPHGHITEHAKATGKEEIE